MKREIDFVKKPETFVGHLLVAHPQMADPYFQKAVVLITIYSPEAGAIGVILNRPLEAKLEQLSDQFENSVLSDVPVYSGGPLDDDVVVVAALQWEEETRSCKIVFGLGPDRADDLLGKHSGLKMKGFLGHSGWESGQLEGEVDYNDWLVLPLSQDFIEEIDDPDQLWVRLLGKVSPEWLLEEGGPNNPEKN